MSRSHERVALLTPAALWRVGGAAVALIVFWSVVVVYVGHSALPLNPIRLPLQKQLRITAWAPEGWAFFTRSAREERYHVLRPSAEGRWENALLAPHNRLENALGMNRKSRAQGVEMGMMFNAVPTPAWRKCKGDPAACAATAPVAMKFTNISPRPTLCGDVALALQAPLPWAWARLPRASQMHSRVARLEVVCR